MYNINKGMLAKELVYFKVKEDLDVEKTKENLIYR